MNSIHSPGKSFFRTDLSTESRAAAIEIPEHEDGVAIIPGRENKPVLRKSLISTDFPSAGFR